MIEVLFLEHICNKKTKRPVQQIIQPAMIDCWVLLVQRSLQMLPGVILQNQHTKGLKPCDSVMTHYFPVMTSKRDKSVPCQISVPPIS